MSPPGRRDVLAGLATAGAAGLAGCLGANGSEWDVGGGSDSESDSGSGFSPGSDGSTEWPAPAFDAGATSYVPDGAAPRVPPGVRWRAETAEPIGRPVVAGGVALVPAADGLYAFDARTGERLWTHGGDRDRPYGAVVADDTAYATLRDEPATLALALDDGSVRWRTTGAADFASAPLVAPAGDRVYTGDTAGRVCALDASSGERLWSFDAFTGVYALAARRDGLFVGTTGGGTYQLLATPAEAVPIWRRKLPGTVRALTATDGSVFAATFDGGWFRLRAGARAGRTEWHAADAPTVTESLVHTGGTLVGAGRDRVTAYGAGGGGRRWSSDVAPPVRPSAPAAAGDTLYVGVGGRLRALALGGGSGVGPYRLGTERWSYDLAPRAVAVADGAVFAVADDVDGAPGIVALE